MARCFAIAAAVAWTATLVPQASHAQEVASPFKLGTFEREGRTFTGIVLDDERVVDLPAADAAIAGSTVAPPADMKDLIGRYHEGLRERIVQIVAAVESAPSEHAAYVHGLDAVRVLPPIMYPTTILNAAVNYRAHGEEMETVREAGVAGPGRPGLALPGTTSMPGIWERAADDERWNPYLFLKSPTAVIAHGEGIRLPRGRTRIDWECEMGVVIGRTANGVSVEGAADHIFGYTILNDVSDRGGRGDSRHGSDWLIGKSHDTFAPLGPFILPKEFVPDPQNLAIKFTLNGEVMQDANTSQMIHDVFELVAYGAGILTLLPGDVIATGSPDGVGSARNPPIFLQDGDLSVCTYEGVGTLVNPVVGPGS